MTFTLSEIFRRCVRAAAAGCVTAMLCAGASPALGFTRTDLYQAAVPMTERSEASQAAAFQAALRTVLVRVTGRRGAGEESVFAPLYGNARRYVQQYRSTADGKLWVSFDGPAIERWLAQNGQPSWGAERPATLVWLSVGGAGGAAAGNGATSGAVITADDTSDLKGSIDAAATTRGAPLIWPSAADVQRGQAPADLAHRLNADGLLVGHAANATDGATVRWTFAFQDRNSEVSGAVEGVNRAADTYAATFAANGALAPVEIDVAGIGDVRAYAGAGTYLESLALVSHVGVESLHGDSVRFRVMTRGGSEPLQRALAAGGKLQPAAAGDDGVPRYQWRR